jgi:hypothetical protein
MTDSTKTADAPHAKYVPVTPTRGRIVILQGRGDDPSYYKRLGLRLALDGYESYVPTRVASNAGDAATIWNELTENWEPETPTIAITADTAGGFLTNAATEQLLDVLPDGIVLTGLALEDAEVDGGTFQGEEELTLRSACPVHRSVVHAATDTERLLTSAIVPVAPKFPLTTDNGATAKIVPTLVIHGVADAISPIDQVRSKIDGWSSAELVSVSGGLHDVVNDVHHRTVAAEIISFAERIRSDAAAASIVTKEVL